MDGLAVDGSSGTFAVDTQGAIVTLSRPSTSYITASHASGALRFDTGGSVARLRHSLNNGDISFYEDTGSTAKLFWDASAESLGIGETNPDASLSHNMAIHQVISFDESDASQEYSNRNSFGTGAFAL